MKQNGMLKYYMIAAILSVQLLSGCLKDNVTRTFKIYQPVYKSLTEVRAGMKSSAAQPITHPGKLTLYNNYIFINEVDKGIHIIDNTDPSHPLNAGYIQVPGNGDMAIKGQYLYADSYSDLVVFDISDPKNVSAKKFVNHLFTDRDMYDRGTTTTNPDSIQVVVDYIIKDTTIDADSYPYYRNCSNCMFYDMSSAPVASAKGNGVGVNGSMSRFAIINNYLYGVSTSELYAINIQKGDDPQISNHQNIGNWNIETIYPLQDKLFIGSNNGMYIYDISDPAMPNQLSQYAHIQSCDPVIADDQYAFVTLRSGTACQGYSNQLEVIDVSTLTKPSIVKVYPMTNPHGLSKDDDRLFICDGKDGLKMYDISSVTNLQLLQTVAGMETYDVVAQNGRAIVVADKGLYQYDYKDGKHINLLSTINFNH